MTRKHKKFGSISEIKDYASRFGMKTRGQFARLVWLLTKDADPHDIAGIWNAYNAGKNFEASLRLAKAVLPDCTFSIVEGEQPMAFGGRIPRNRCEVRNAEGKLVCQATVWDGPNEQAVIHAIVNTVFMTNAEAKLWEPVEEDEEDEEADAVMVTEISLVSPRE